MSGMHSTARIQRPSLSSAVAVGLFVTLIGLLLPGTAWAQRGFGGGATPVPTFLDADQQFEVVDQGAGWQSFRNTDPNARSVPNAVLVAVWPNGVDTAPLPESIKDELRDDFGIKPGSGKERFANAAKANSTHAIVVDKALAEAIANGDSLDPWAQYVEADTYLKGSCFGWKTKNKDWDWGFDEWSENRSFDLPGNITGNVGLDVPLRGQANLVLTYSYKSFACVPYKFRFDQARFHGNVDILGSSDLTASFSLQGQWSHEWEIFNEKLGSSTFWVGPIPIYLEYRLPFFIGYEIAAELAGSVSLDTSFGVSGTFDYTCTRDTCTGSSNFDRGPEEDQLTGGIELDVRAQLNARLMFRVALYDEDFLYAEAGAKGLLDGHLWGYYGNNCGDGDGDGVNETVEALVAEANAGYDWVYGYGGILGDRLWTSTGQRWFLGYWDLLGTGNSTALGAMIHGPSEVAPGATASYDISLRPCYPFDEPAWFGMAPGEWNGELQFINKGETKTVSRTFNSTGGVALRARVNHDQKGRQIGIDQWRTIQVRHPEPDAALVVSYIPANGGNRRTYRSEEQGVQPTQLFLYDGAQGNFENRAGGACPDGQPDNPTYLKLAYDGPTITSCRFKTQLDDSPIECNSSLVNQFNSGNFFVVNTDTYQIKPSTCAVADTPLRVCGPHDYCWAWVEFDLPGGQKFQRSVAYRKYF